MIDPQKQATIPVLLVEPAQAPTKLDALQFLRDSAPYELVRVTSAADAVRAAEARDFAVVLVDFILPGSEAIDAIRAVRPRRSSREPVPVILLTAPGVSPERLHEGYAAGAVDFVVTPIDPVVLKAKCEVFVALYGARLNAGARAMDLHDQRETHEAAQRTAEAVLLASEQELRASEERFHQLVDAVTDYAIFMLDARGVVQTWNPGVEKTKGYTRDEIVGQHFSVFYTPEDRAAGKPARVLDTVRREGRYEEEGWRVRKDGSRFWASVVITALRNTKQEITGFAKVTRDLTARREAQENEQRLAVERMAREVSETERRAAVEARRELERVNRMKDEFLATMSHELRTPLNAIQGWATILRKNSGDATKLARGLEVIDRNAKAQMSLITDLLDVSRIISGKLELSRSRVEVPPLLQAAADVVRPAAEGRGVKIVLDVEPEVGALIADADRLQQVVWNLLSNAVRFTPRGGVVTVQARHISSAFVCRVIDTGAGIAQEHIDHIFDRFMQVDSSTTRSHGGLGLGLSIVRHIVEAHGGSVEAESAGPGKGATFTVTIPIAAVSLPRKVESAPAERVTHGEERDPASASRGPTRLDDVRLLAVDDDLDSLELVRMVLAEAGAHVKTASSARAALEALDAGLSFDVLVSDIAMPEVDGYSLMRHVRQRPQAAGLPAIALTAHARAEDGEQARRAGFQEHLTKPVDERLLVEVVRSVADSRRDRAPRGG